MLFGFSAPRDKYLFNQQSRPGWRDSQVKYQVALLKLLKKEALQDFGLMVVSRALG